MFKWTADDEKELVTYKEELVRHEVVAKNSELMVVGVLFAIVIGFATLIALMI